MDVDTMAMDHMLDPSLDTAMDQDDMAVDYDASQAAPPPQSEHDEDQEEGQVSPSEVVPHKVNISGLESLNTGDVQLYTYSHCPNVHFKVEWVNDTSANIVFDSELIANEALEAFSAQTTADQTETRQAKALSSNPDVQLFVRLATVADAKKRGAAHESRYYLMHPDADPLSRPLHQRNRRANRPRRDAGRDSNGDHRDRYGYRSRDYEFGTKGGLNYDEEEPEQEEQAAAARTARGGGDDLFAAKGYGRLRDRSASPMRDSDGDGRYGFADEQPARRTARARSRDQPRRGPDNRASRRAIAGDLFPKAGQTSVLMESSDEHSNSAAARELFPDRVSHRRQDAKDISSDELAHAIGHRPEKPEQQQPRDLFSRITGGPGKRVDSAHGRLADRPASAGDAGQGFSIKGAGADKGYSFLGASKESLSSAGKELFPHMAAAARNDSQDLFAGKLTGRSTRRSAADFF